MSGFEALTAMGPYPGRIVGVGALDTEHNVGIYGVTVRTPMFQKRTLKVDPKNGNKVLLEWTGTVTPEDVEQIQKNGTTLANLVYPAIVADGALYVSNGGHVEEIVGSSGGLAFRIQNGMSSKMYETDPCNTARIIAAINRTTSVLGIVKDMDARAKGLGGKGNRATTQYFDFGLSSGQGRFISTYCGDLKNALPFQGEPLPFEIDSSDPFTIAREMYHSIADNSEKQVKVLTAAVTHNIITGGFEWAMYDRGMAEAGK